MTTSFLLLTSLLGADLRVEAVKDARHVRVVASVGQHALTKLADGKISQQEGRRWLRLQLVDDDGKLLPPVFGRYTKAGKEIRFAPRYPLVHGFRYRVTLLNGRTIRKSVDYVVPKRRLGPPPAVTRIYPSAKTLPANQLKFYVYFSNPMREGIEIFDRIHLYGPDGKQIQAPWRRSEMWTIDARRLTLWIHPGRIKQGVNLREEQGPVLRPGFKYRLVVSSNVVGADGQKLQRDTVKEFTTAAPDHERPLPQRWKVTSPNEGTRGHLKIDLREPLDHSNMQRLITVHDAADRTVKGQVVVAKGETVWSFQPKRPWTAQRYRIRIDPLLEDRAGNTPARVFDRDLRRQAGQPPRLYLRFTPK